MISLTEMVAEARRELALRRTCYPHWIKSGKLDMEAAMRRLQAMDAIVQTLTRLEIESRQLPLFRTG